MRESQEGEELGQGLGIALGRGRLGPGPGAGQGQNPDGGPGLCRDTGPSPG